MMARNSAGVAVFACLILAGEGAFLVSLTAGQPHENRRETKIKTQPALLARSVKFCRRIVITLPQYHTNKIKTLADRPVVCQDETRAMVNHFNNFAQKTVGLFFTYYEAKQALYQSTPKIKS